MENKKAQSIIPNTVVGWAIALAALVLLIVIIYNYRENIASMLSSAFDIFRFGA